MYIWKTLNKIFGGKKDLGVKLRNLYSVKAWGSKT